jgi:hypothetical protein
MSGKVRTPNRQQAKRAWLNYQSSASTVIANRDNAHRALASNGCPRQPKSSTLQQRWTARAVPRQCRRRPSALPTMVPELRLRLLVDVTSLIVELSRCDDRFGLVLARQHDDERSAPFARL